MPEICTSQQILWISAGWIIEPIERPAIHVLYASNFMGSIYLHQSAGLCAQPEAAQENP